MIIDQIENWERYHLGAPWKLAFEFLNSVTPDAEDKKHLIQGDDIFALVMSYQTRPPQTAVLETHQKYVDIQVVLVGGEAIEWFPRKGLIVDTPYNEAKEAQFYKRTCPGPVRMDLLPGTFAVFFPQDAHMPALMLNDTPQLIKKVVVKIKCGLFK